MVFIRTDVLGVGFDNLTMNDATKKAMALMETKSGAYVVTPNPEIVMLCRENPELLDAVSGAALVLPDGVGVVYGARILGTPLRQKLPGIDFAQELFSLMAQKGMSVFLLGAKDGVAEKARDALETRYPGLRITGVNNGYFTEDEPVIEKINNLNPDLLLVCLGAPKQEIWMKNNAAKLKVGLMAGLGGSLDVFSGETERAPEGWQRLGLEWLHRLLGDPGRIKRMKNLPKFGFTVIGKRIAGND